MQLFNKREMPADLFFSGGHSAQFALEPGLGKFPVAKHSEWRYVQDFGRFLHTQSAEEPQLDHLAGPLAHGCKTFQRFIQRHKVGTELRGNDKRLFYGNRTRSTAPLVTAAGP